MRLLELAMIAIRRIPQSTGGMLARLTMVFHFSISFGTSGKFLDALIQSPRRVPAAALRRRER